jgi:hypothetical protein
MVLLTAFVDTYKLMMLMCMALAMVSALLAAILIGRQPAKETGVRRLVSGDRGPIRPVSQGVRK